MANVIDSGLLDEELENGGALSTQVATSLFSTSATYSMSSSQAVMAQLLQVYAERVHGAQQEFTELSYTPLAPVVPMPNPSIEAFEVDRYFTIDKEFFDPVNFPQLQEGIDISMLRPTGMSPLGVEAGNLTFGFEANQATLTFRDGYAGYNNTLGVYRIAEDGTIEDVDILFTNVKDLGIDNTTTIDLPVGSEGGEIGFFIIGNGDRVNDGYGGLDGIEDMGSVRFVYDYGGVNERAARVTDNGTEVSAVHTSQAGLETVLGGYHYHSYERGEDFSVNSDGMRHVVSGLTEAENNNVLRIGFEDLYGTGDADYEDVLFDLDIIAQTQTITITIQNVIEGTGQGDLLAGTQYNDLIRTYGGNDVIINSSAGNDIIEGGGDVDTLSYNGNTTRVIIDMVRGIVDKNGDGVIDDYFDGVENIQGSNYDDIVFGDDGDNTITGLNGVDVLRGGAGNDVLRGGSDGDLLFSDTGHDQLYGQLGADIFIVLGVEDANTSLQIKDFNLAQGDVLDLSLLVEGYDALQDSITDFVQITDDGTHSYFAVDLDGVANGVNFEQVGRLDSLVGLDMAQLENDGHLIL